MTHRREKSLILDQVKSIVETSLQFITGTKESGGNLKNTQWHKLVDDNSELLTRSVHKLVHTLEDQSSSIGIMSGLSENIRKLISTLDTTMLTNQGHFVEYQTRMVEILRQMARTTQEILTQTDQTDNIRHLANQLTREYNELINATYGAIGTATTNELATRIKSVVADLGFTCIELIEKLGLYQQNHHDQSLRQDLETLSQRVIEKVSVSLSLTGSVLQLSLSTDLLRLGCSTSRCTWNTSLHQCSKYRQWDYCWSSKLTLLIAAHWLETSSKRTRQSCLPRLELWILNKTEKHLPIIEKPFSKQPKHSSKTRRHSWQVPHHHKNNWPQLPRLLCELLPR